jgi:hypothetical protein
MEIDNTESDLIKYIKGYRTLFVKNKPIVDYFDWLLKNGKYFTKDDVVDDIFINKHISFVNRSVVKQCYHNVMLLGIESSELRMFFGYTNSIIPMEHAFFVTIDNKVFDSTMIMLSKKYDDKDSPTEWFGIEIPKEFALKYMTKFKESNNLLKPYYFYQKENKLIHGGY